MVLMMAKLKLNGCDSFTPIRSGDRASPRIWTDNTEMESANGRSGRGVVQMMAAFTGDRQTHIKSCNTDTPIKKRTTLFIITVITANGRSYTYTQP